MHVRRALALAVLAPLLLGGCSDDPQPEPTPKMPETSTSTPTDEPTATETNEVESAEDFIRRWQAAALEAQNRGDTSAYRALGPQCGACTDFADQVDEIYSGGGSVELESLRVISVEPASGANQFRLTRLLGGTRVLDSQGQEEQSFAGGREVLNVFLEKVRGDWQVQNFLRTSA